MSLARWTVLGSAGALLALAGCVTPPPKSDPYAELMISNGGAAAPKTYPATDLALLLSKNTAGTRKYLHDFAGSGGTLFMHNYWPSAKFDADEVLSGFTRLLVKHFKSVHPIEDFADAQPGGAKLVAMLDVTAVIAPPPSSRISTLEAKIIFLRPDKSQVAVMSASESGEVGYNRSSTMIPEIAAQAEEKLNDELLESSALAQFDHPAGIAAAPQTSRTYSSDVDVPGYRLAERPSDFAVVIGIEDYSNIPAARFAERDSQAVRAHLVALGYPRQNIILLNGPKAAKTGIEKYLLEWLPRNITPDSTVFFYFSGHGSPDPETGQAYLMPWDADAKFLATTAYPLKTLYRQLNGLKAKQVFVAMDSCFSGAGGRSVVASGLRPLVSKVDVGSSSTDKLVVFSASGPNEVTGSLDDFGHGLFTYQFLKGLQVNQGRVTPQALFDYVSPKVEEGARRDNREQTPTLRPDASSVRLLAPL